MSLWNKALFLSLAVLTTTSAHALENSPPASVTAPWPGFAGSFLIARAAENRGDWQLAEEAFASTAARDPYTPEFIHRRSVLLLNQGRFDAASALAGEMEGKGNATHLAHLLVFAEAARVNDVEGADAAFRRMSNDGLGQYLKPFFAAWMASSFREAQEALRPVSDLPSLSPMVKLHTALLADRFNETTIARQNFARVIAEAPSYRAVALAAAFYARHDMSERREALLVAARQAGVEPMLVAALRETADKHNMVDDLASGVAEAVFSLAGLLQKEGANDVALPYLRIVTALRPDFALARLMVGDLMLRLGRYDEAAQIYRDASASADIGALATLRLAALETRLNGAVPARERLLQLVADKPDWVEAWAQLGDTALTTGDVHAATGYYTRAIELAGTGDRELGARLLFARALAHHRLQDMNKAEADLRASLALVPDNAERLNFLGYLWADRGVRLDEAEQLVSKAIALEPGSPQIIDSLGWIKYRAGALADAVRLLEMAAELSPYNPVVNDHLGDAYWAAGREREARFQWERAIAYRASGDSTLTSVEDLRRKIAQGIMVRQAAVR